MGTNIMTPPIVTNGLVLHLDVANSRSYTSGSTIWNDLSGNNNNGTLTNGPTFSSANGGNIVFDGTNDYIDTGKTATQLGVYDANYTFDAWVYPTDFTNDRTMFGTDTSATREGLHLVFRNGTIYQGHYSADYGVGTGTLNAWNNICYTYTQSSGAASIYKNGILQGTGTIASFIGTTNILIGRWIGAQYFIGNGGIYKIYNRVLSAQEVKQNYNSQKSRFNLI
jgi:hypothetical protein